MILTAIVFLLMLSLLVLIHEAGHYFVAKRFGIKVEEFGFGLPPRLLGKKIGETIYSINWLPIGGFVRLYGEDEAGSGKVQLKVKSEKLKVEDEKRAFYGRSVWQRALVVGAGVFMNAILAVIIFYTFLFISGFKTELPLEGNYHFFFVHQVNKSDIIISTVAKDSPAMRSGIEPFSKIISVNGFHVSDTNEFLQIVNSNRGKQISIAWKNLQSGKTKTATLIPRVSVPKNQGAIGIGFFANKTAELIYETPAQKLLSGFVHPVNLMAYNFTMIGQRLQLSLQEKTTKPLGDAVTGPVGIYSLVGVIVHIPDLKERVLQVLNLAGIISISLAFFNVLPIPALDGGRLFFILLEGVIGKKVPAKFEGYAHALGMAALLGLLLLVTLKDISQFFK